MKKHLLVAAIAVLSLGMLSGCGKDKVPTIQEIYDANKDLVKEDDMTIEYKMSFEASASTSLLEMYLGSDSVGIKGTLEGERCGDISHANIDMDVNMGSESESVKAEAWDDTKNTYVSTMGSSWMMQASEAAEVVETMDDDEIDDMLADIQDAIDDKDAEFKEKGSSYVLTYEMPLSELADMDEVVDELKNIGITASKLEDLEGALVIKAKFDNKTLYFESFEIYLDDDAKESLCDLVSMYVSDLSIDECYFSFEMEVKDDDDLKIPSDVKDDAIESDADLSDLLGGDFGGDDYDWDDDDDDFGSTGDGSTIEDIIGSELDLTSSMPDDTYSSVVVRAYGNSLYMDYTFANQMDVTDENYANLEATFDDEMWKQIYEMFYSAANIYPDCVDINVYNADGSEIFWDYRYYSDLY